jgi:AAA family ATP:ADP antiporter
MRALLARLMDVREGEGRIVFQVFSTLFGVIAAHTMLETARDALFLGKLPPSRLTLVYAILAGLALGVSAVNTAFVRRFGRRNALIFSLMGAAWGTTVLHFAPRVPAVLFGLYVWSGLLGTLLAVQFWMLAGQLFTVAQGKRLFGPIAAGGVLGAVFGASLAAAAVEVVPIGDLLLVAAGIFLVTAGGLTSVRSDESRPASEAPGAAKAILPRGTFALFREEPYLIRVAALIAVSTAAVLTTDYLFKSVAAARVPPAELGTFFARYYAVLNGVSLVVQVGLAGRILRGLGVGPALMVLPVLVGVGGAGTLVFGGALAMAMLAKGADGALRHSLQRVAGELLWMPLSAEIRDRGKAVIDTVFGRLVQAAVAGALLLLAALGLSSPRLLAAIVVGLAAIWVGVTAGLRRPYLDLFRRALRRGSLDAGALGDDLDIGSVEAIMEALSSRDAARVIAAMEVLQERKRSRLIPGLILYHESPEVLVRALAVVAASDRGDWVPLAERLLTHPAEAVRVAAVRALGEKGDVEAVARAAEDESPAVRAHAAFCLADRAGAADLRADPRITAILRLEGGAGRAARVALLDAIHDNKDPRWADVILDLAACDDALVVEHAAMAMTRAQDPRFVPLLIARLTVRDGRGAVREALVSHGEPAFDALVQALRDPETDPRVRVHTPRTLSRFGTQRAADVLLEQLLLEPSGLVRYKILRGLGRLVSENKVKVDRSRLQEQMRRNLVEYFRLLSLSVPLARGQRDDPSRGEGAGKLIVGLLEDKQQQSLERAFRLLQIAHRNEDIRTVYYSLRFGDRRRRAHALEFLDALTLPSRRREEGFDPGTRELFRLVADDLSPEDRVARAAAYLPTRPATYEEAVSALLREKDESLAALAAYHALEMGHGGLRERVAEAYRARPTLSLEGSLEVFGLKEALGVG